MSDISSQNEDDSLFLQQYIKPIREQTDIADMICEQDYRGVDKQKIHHIYANHQYSSKYRGTTFYVMRYLFIHEFITFTLS